MPRPLSPAASRVYVACFGRTPNPTSAVGGCFVWPIWLYAFFFFVFFSSLFFFFFFSDDPKGSIFMRAFFLLLLNFHAFFFGLTRPRHFLGWKVWKRAVLSRGFVSYIYTYGTGLALFVCFCVCSMSALSIFCFFFNFIRAKRVSNWYIPKKKSARVHVCTCARVQ